MIRLLALIAGLCGAGALSQFPEFSQQYYQRLSGAVDELRPLVLTVDLTARAQGLTRQDALAQLQGNDTADSIRESLAQSVRRYDRLSAAQTRLAEATPLERLAQPWNIADPDLFDRTLADYRPALPLTQAGLISGLIGFAFGWGMVGSFFALLRRVFVGRWRSA
ncbi:MAG: DUF2937 family protein [Pseudomonadota bacterium]